MSDNSVAATQVKELKKKLDAAIKSRAELEEGCKNQSSQLVKFIGKLSHVCKGIDLKLDNKLADFRTLLTKSAPLAEIELHINEISTLLQKHANNNDQNIKQLHQQFHEAGKLLQKIKGLPPQLRRHLRGLLENNIDSKEAVIQYVPLLTQLITLYESALKAKVSLDETTPISSDKESNFTDNTSALAKSANAQIIRKFSQLLDDLSLSEKHASTVEKIKQSLTKELSNEELINCFIEVFDVILVDLKTERDSTESFLSALSNTLTRVQNAVKSTLAITNASEDNHSALNNQLLKHIDDMTVTVDSAISLTDVKEEVQNQLLLIAKTIESKTQLELENQQTLKKQLQAMSSQITVLKKQSKEFEERLHEQQRKNKLDALTKLNNRAAFDQHFAQEMVRFHQQHFDLAIAVIDIDNFKRINDTYGHTAGDKTLQVIAKTLQALQAKNVFAARYGGEEFVLIFSHTSKTDLFKSLEWLRQKIASLPFKFKQDRVTITLSIGATHIKENDNLYKAFERADKGLYQAKNNGKNQVIYM
jgi:diguanylate cyclase (GGDEF)-like protein